MNEWGTPGLPLADLPASKFWPRVTDNLKLEDSDLWQEELGLHPKSPLWDGVTKMMIRNVPARCSQTEIEQLLSYVTTDFRLQMPRSSERKCKGYAFIEGDADVMRRLAHFLWQRQVPTRHSLRPLKIHPARGFEQQ
ncbi:unnamed protein product [Cladocopium goreaui]|uniref:RRM domain-containing protein n=1 Tax=Cladocopium goreaui TaxID=2562237 RepID=A0A9P1DHH4_9DINO|nr:unnamed protein product [Cladocopium goreaui]|mmetsp:Transcript_53266/g.116226  ORF Transcript_53266/g.116226 Transcript_53266/m.116226 type:complete len:137 (+) Transcript_53266:170-580(+)